MLLLQVFGQAVERCSPEAQQLVLLSSDRATGVAWLSELCVRSIPAWERARAARRREAAEAGEGSNEEEVAQNLRAVRAKLCGLLEASELVDAGLVLECVSDGELWDEQVLLQSKVHCRALLANP